MKSLFLSRVGILFVFMFLLAFVLIVRLYMVQIIHGDVFSDRADRQYVRPNENFYDRGSIFFEDKSGRLVSGATIKSGYTVAINPTKLEDPSTLYESLNAIVPIDQDTFFFRSGKKDDPYEELVKRVATNNAEKIDALGIRGLNVYKERWRFYPGDTLASHTLGFVGYKGDTLSGRYGLERYYNDVLTREDSSVYVNFFAEIFTNLNKTLFENDTKRAGDIITSLELSVQLFLEDTLEAIHADWGSTLTAGVIINPNNGEIFALGV